MKLITKRNCFNDTYMLHKGSEIEIVREYLFEGHPAIVFKDVESSEEFRCMKHENPNFEEVSDDH